MADLDHISSHQILVAYLRVKAAAAFTRLTGHGLFIPDPRRFIRRAWRN